MFKHWEHEEIVSKDVYEQFREHNIAIKPTVSLGYNTAVYVNTVDGKRLEGIYDPIVKGIRQLTDKSSKNRDLRLYKDALDNPNITVLAIDGLMGTGKTSSVIEHVVNSSLSSVRVSDRDLMEGEFSKPVVDERRVLIAKPAVNAGGEEYGFLPGDKDEKLKPLLGNYTQYFDRFHQSGFDLLQAAGYVDILPLGFIRGLDAVNLDLIVDECQNTRELVTVVTRRAKDSRIFLMGDTSPFQIDLVGNTPKENGLTDIIDLLRGAPYFQYIEMKSLEHIVRSDEVRDIVKRLFKKYGEDPQGWIL